MAGANNVAHLVLGAPILISSPQVIFDVLEKFPVVPQSLDRMRSCSVEYGTTASMLMPQNADFFAVVVDKVGGLYVRPRGEDGAIYCMKPEFALLGKLIPPDSSCLVLVYLGGSGDMRMGLYDLMRNAGVDLTEKSILERHSILHDTFHFNLQKLKEHAASHSHHILEEHINISVHWVGWQEACMRVIAEGSQLPFETACICRLDADAYVHMITPIQTR